MCCAPLNRLFVVALFGFLPALSAFGQAAEFKRLELTHAATALTTSEDGKQIFVAHERDDLISVLDAATGEVKATMSTKRPLVILVRANKVLVGNQGAGTISVFARDKAFKQTDEVETGFPEMKWMSAPQGKYFKGWVVVTAKQHDAVARIQLVDVNKDKHHSVGGNKVGVGAANVTYDGKSYIVQHDVWGGGFVSEVRDFAAAIAAKESDSPKFSREHLWFLYQVRPGPYWFGDTRICTGHPPQPMQPEPLGRLTVPDRTQNVCYVIDPTTVRCLALGPKMQQIGEQTTAFPKDYDRMGPDALKPNQAQRNDFGFNDRHHAAVTVDGKLSIYLFSEKPRAIFFRSAPAFDTASVPAAEETASTDSSPPETGDESGADNTLPAKVSSGKRVTLKLQAAAGSTWDIVSGPKGASIATDGTFAWTPTKVDTGPQQFKIKRKSGGKVDFIRLSTEVVDISDLAGKPPVIPTPNRSTPGVRPPVAPPAESEPDLEDVGIHPLTDVQVGLSYSLDGNALLVADGDTLKVIDHSGLAVVKSHTFTSRYRQWIERPEYYVALAAKSIDLIDKKSLAVIKSIDVDYAQLNSMAVHPTKKVTYVGVMKPSEKDHIASKPILEVNEETGAVKALSDVYGMWLAVNRDGSRLVTGLHQIYKDESGFNLRDKFAHVDLVTSYDITGDRPLRNSINEQPGANGRRFVMSPDGKHVSYIAGGGAGGYGYSIAALAVEDVSRESSRYQIEAYPTDLAYHPALNLVACTNGKRVWIFNRKTGEPEQSRWDERTAFKDIERIFFAPGGRRLMVAHKHPSRGLVLQAVSIKLTPEEESAAPPPPGTTARPVAADATSSTKGMKKVWTDQTGKFRIDAELVDVKNGMAVLKRADGEVIQVKVDAFSAEDQRLLRNAK